MRTIRAIFRDGGLTPLEPLDLPENTSLTLTVLDEDDLPADGLARTAQAGEAFDFLNDSAEDLYAESDGEALSTMAKPAAEPSPFITETATKVFRTMDDALRHFQQIGYIGAFQKPLFANPPGAAKERGRFG